MKKLLSLLFLFVVIGTSQVATADSTQFTPLPLHFWPMNENFSMIPVNAPPCYSMGFGYPPVEIDNGTYALISGVAYTGCTNVSNPEVKIIGIRVNNFSNRTFKSIKVAYYVSTPYRVALDLQTTNMTIVYKPYNSTHELVLVELSNITIGPESREFIGTSDPSAVGWPRELRLEFLVDKVTGEGYLIYGEEKKYVGLFPLLPAPYLSPDNYIRGLLYRTKQFISTVETNPWIVEQVIEKAKASDDVRKASAYIQGFAMNVTSNILNPKGNYLGQPAVVVRDYVRLNGSTKTVLDFMSGVTKPYTVPTITGGSMIVNESEAKSAMLAYLRDNDPQPLKELVLSHALTSARSPYLIWSFGDGRYAIVDFHVPLDSWGLLTLPLPPGYNGSYILIKPFVNASEPFLHVEYDPSLYTPENITTSWETVGQCIEYLRNSLINEVMNIMYNISTQDTVNVSRFEVLYPFVIKQLNACGLSVPEDLKDTQTPAADAKTENTTSRAITSNKSDKNTHICGPAFLLPLALIPALLWRKRK